MTDALPPTVSATDLSVRLADPMDAARPQLLDVREDDEWAAGHLPGAVHIPLAQVPERLSEVPEGDLVVMCRSGGRSARAQAWLAAHGRESTNLEGGLHAWEDAGLPLEGPGDTAGYVA